MGFFVPFEECTVSIQTTVFQIRTPFSIKLFLFFENVDEL